MLMKPRMILAVIAGGAAGVFTFMITGAGLVATPSPGSIFAYLTMTPRGGYFGVILGVLIATGVSFLVGAVLLGFGKASGDTPADEDEAPAEAETETEATSESEARSEAGAETGAEGEDAHERNGARKDGAPVMKEA
ncbi:hypothetical protein [Thermocatellispora tengchongensis]|uniref:hypothetical protein n=1 Tax=Thermocatellispora tengchongensis TaxID=1073253 RepID=UPI00363AF2C0